MKTPSLLHSNMKQQPRLAAVLLAALSVSACSPPPKTPDIKRNPNPKQSYELTLTIKDAPGPLEFVDANALYVTDSGCVPLRPFIGAANPVETSVPIAFEKVAPDTYRAAVYQDLLKDEDYYGLGVCHWRINIVGATHEGGGVLFDSLIGGRDSYAPDGTIALSQSDAMYYLKKDYGDASLRDRHASFLATDNVASRPEKDHFSITITSKADFQ